MPGFPNSLFSIGNLCDAGLYCAFAPSSVYAYDPLTNSIKLQGWRVLLSRLWRFLINNIVKNRKLKPNDNTKFIAPKFVANSAYDLPSTTALIRYLHAVAGILVKETWCEVIKFRNCIS